MKIGLMTIHNANNYGAVLQAYALKETLKEFGEVEIIGYDNRHISISLDFIRFGFSFHHLLGMCKDICRLFPRVRAIRKFNKFINNQMDVVSYDENRDYSDLDFCIAGSDQIWNPSCISADKKFNDMYFLELSNAQFTKISYASSCGAHKFSELEESYLKSKLSNFKSLSVREKSTAENLTRLVGRNVSHVLDPTLLLNKEEWLSRFVLEDKKEDYILLYFIKKTPLLKATVKYFSSKLKMKVITVNQGLSAGVKVDEHIRDAGPNDFINLFNNALFVITDSFHGTTFSVNFNKKFVAVSPGENVNRIQSLLEVLGLKDRIVKSETDLVNDLLDLNYVNPNQKLLTQVELSKSYLTQSLKVI
jgi:hypothetical protein